MKKLEGKKMKNLKNKKGFTLIELIVAIAILGILALFLLPQFMGYSQDAKLQVAKANTRTVWTAAKAAETTSEYKEFKDLTAFTKEVTDKLGTSFTVADVKVEATKNADGKTWSLTSVSYKTNGVTCTYKPSADEDDIKCTTTE